MSIVQNKKNSTLFFLSENLILESRVSRMVGQGVGDPIAFDNEAENLNYAKDAPVCTRLGTSCTLYRGKAPAHIFEQDPNIAVRVLFFFCLENIGLGTNTKGTKRSLCFTLHELSDFSRMFWLWLQIREKCSSMPDLLTSESHVPC